MPGKKGPSQKAVDELVTSYLIDSVKEHAQGEDEELFDKILALHELAVAREAGHDPAERIGAVKTNPLIRGAVAAMGERIQRLVDTGVKIAQDTKILRIKLRERLADEGLDPSDPGQYAECVLEYERVLADTIPLPQALHNVDAVAELVDLANEVLHPGGGLKRTLYDMGWSAFRKIIFKDPQVLEAMEELKAEVQADPERLKRVSKLIRKLGPGIVKEAYARAEGGAEPRRVKKAAPKKASKKKA